MNSRRISRPIGARFKNVLYDFGKPGIFFNSRQGYASSGVYNINGVLRSSFEFLIGFRTLFEFWIGFGTLLDGHTESNLRTSLRSYVYSVYYRTGRCRIKTVLNDQSGSVRNSLSVRHRRPRFARPPIGVRRDRLRTLLDGRTHTI